ncbi:hypothetical protein [Porphyromonas macacae]|nr:hypothetical protein [Porphyromonas macacae]
MTLVNKPIIGWNIDPLDWKYRNVEKVTAEMSKRSRMQLYWDTIFTKRQ